MHRFAGLWTGDNASTWNFLAISIAQALALGVSGMTIAGGDVGGFLPGKPGEKYTEPELLIRWYSASFLLPWFRFVIITHCRYELAEPILATTITVNLGKNSFRYDRAK